MQLERERDSDSDGDDLKALSHQVFLFFFVFFFFTSENLVILFLCRHKPQDPLLDGDIQEFDRYNNIQAPVLCPLKNSLLYIISHARHSVNVETSFGNSSPITRQP